MHLEIQNTESKLLMSDAKESQSTNRSLKPALKFSNQLNNANDALQGQSLQLKQSPLSSRDHQVSQRKVFPTSQIDGLQQSNKEMNVDKPALLAKKVTIGPNLISSLQLGSGSGTNHEHQNQVHDIATHQEYSKLPQEKVATERRLTENNDEEEEYNFDDDDYDRAKEGGHARILKRGAIKKTKTQLMTLFQGEKLMGNNSNNKSSVSQKRMCIIKSNGRFRTSWDIYVVILSLWNCFTLPVDIAFQPSSFDSTAIKIFNNLIDISFLMDLFLNFRTTVSLDLYSDEIQEPKQIAINYLKSRFFIDLFASIPFDTLISLSIGENGTEFQRNLGLLSMLKIFRVFRFTRIISYLNATENVKLSLKLFKLIFYLVLYVHWQACAWFFYTKQDRSWFPLPDIIKEDYHFYDASFTFKYCFSVWHSVSILSGEDIIPATDHQAIVASILLIISEFIRAHILGTMGLVLEMLSRKSTKFQENIEFATSTMKTIKLKPNLQHRILEYLTIKFQEIDTQKDLENLMVLLPPSLKHLVTQHMFLNAITSLSIFQTTPEAIDFIIQNIEALTFMSEDYIIKQGQKATYVYILAQGQCEVLVRDQFKKESFVRDLVQGHLFGEVALLFKTKRTASVRCKDQCTVGAIQESAFNELLKTYPEIESELRVESTRYNDHWKGYQIKMLSAVDYFKELSYPVKEELHYRLNLENHEEGAKLFNRGMECNKIMIIVKGELELFIDQNENEYPLDILTVGSVHGAYSIINESQLQYSGRAKSNLSILTLDRNDLFQMADEIQDISDIIEQATKFILKNDVPWCDYSINAYEAPANTHFLLPEQTVVEKFRNAVRKVQVLNRRRQLKPFKLFELINFIKEERRREAMMKVNNENQGTQNTTTIQRESKGRISMARRQSLAILQSNNLNILDQNMKPGWRPSQYNSLPIGKQNPSQISDTDYCDSG